MRGGSTAAPIRLLLMESVESMSLEWMGRRSAIVGLGAVAVGGDSDACEMLLMWLQ